ncbi:SGNH/GDSL hydrolase family protein [Stackebrandtia nassauensis]|uniref:Triacylglycerol lipase n=1 Tax=Stackebrandtia nassauensis (strain DSM 44728 / CIP 108903 / NRRL B-16338 / NBRC 102104 / LLR-40K-21) TaxID=446470 RepID=D3Q953_STANL|nr:SGNH/GDSL hydrolase family protein [Stackebrandtia nassauensis]ADD40662.1 Triacylglycerol lipase [Stackebrandtia nassauensis DSM 44728]
MNRSRALRLAVLGVVGIVAAGSVVAFAGSESTAVIVAGAKPMRQVAMGDSYSSGVGAGDYDDSGCGRSANAYGPLLADEFSADVDFVACGGATIPDVRAEQLSALSDKTTHVTISVGGNDIGFGGIIVTCANGSDDECVDRIDQAEQDARDRLAGELADLYADMSEAAPDARIIVVGYPKPFHEKECDSAPGFSVAEQRRANTFAEALNAVTAEVADAAGFGFADPVSQFEGHGICSPEPYVKGESLDGSYHPNAAGQRDGYVPAVRKAL